MDIECIWDFPFLAHDPRGLFFVILAIFVLLHRRRKVCRPVSLLANFATLGAIRNDNDALGEFSGRKCIFYVTVTQDGHSRMKARTAPPELTRFRCGFTRARRGQK